LTFSILCCNFNSTIAPLGGVPVSTGGMLCLQLQAERQLLKLAKILVAKKEDEFVFDETTLALAA
jgi:hypothetical protein